MTVDCKCEKSGWEFTAGWWPGDEKCVWGHLKVVKVLFSHGVISQWVWTTATQQAGIVWKRVSWKMMCRHMQEATCLVHAQTACRTSKGCIMSWAEDATVPTVGATQKGLPWDCQCPALCQLYTFWRMWDEYSCRGEVGLLRLAGIGFVWHTEVLLWTVL